MNDNITKLNMVIKSLENDIEERKNLNLLAKKAIAETKKKIKALEKLEAKEKEILGDLYEEPIYKPYTDINRVCGEECGCRPSKLPDYDEELDCGCGEYECRQSDIPVID